MCLLKISVRANDQGVPPMTTDTTVTVLISQDNDTLEFEQTNYSAVLMGNAEIGTEVVQVQASDQDVSIAEVHVSDGDERCGNLV